MNYNECMFLLESKMHILAIAVLVIIGLSFVATFYYENYTREGRLLSHYVETKPSVYVISAIAIAYLFYYYFGM